MEHKITEADSLENGEYLEESPLINLPEEIWSLILEYIPQKDLLEQRVVSREWCRLIDTLANYRVRFCDNQDSNLVETLLMQRVRVCEFLGLKKPFSPKFENPLLVKEITFASSSSSENVANILSTCRDVEKLTFYTTFSADTLFDLSQDYSQTLSGLKKLKEIEIGIQCFQNRAPDSSSTIFETLIGKSNVEFPSLQRLTICFPMFIREWLALFNFLVRHSSSLKSLKIRCFKCPDLDELTEIECSGLKKLNLSTLDIICDSACRHSAVHSAFAKLVAAQRNCEKVNLDLLKFPLSIYIDFVLSNYRTLRSVKFYHVEFGAEYRLDGSMFSECVLLNELTLHCLPRYTVVITLEGDEEGMGNHMNPHPRYDGAVVEGWALPKSLTRLSLKGCHIPTTELIELSTKQCPRLRQLELFGVGSTMSCGYGLTFEAFIQLCENLNELTVFSFRGISCTFVEVNTERDKLRWKTLMEKAEASGICKNREEIGGFDFNDESESHFTFNFPTVAKRLDFLWDVKKTLSVLDAELDESANGDHSQSDSEDNNGEPVPKKLKIGV